MNDALPPILTALVAIASALIGYELGVYKEAHDRQRQQDKDTFARLRVTLTKDGWMNYLRDRDFGGSYKSDMHWWMDELHYLLQDPDNQFIDKQLNEITQALGSSMEAFNRQLAGESTQAGLVDGLSIIEQRYHDEPPPYHRNYTREEFETLQADLNKQATEIWKQYSNLVAAVKRKL